MVIQLFGTKKCKESQKGVRFLKDRAITFHYVDLAEKEISKGEWTKLFQQIPAERLIDENSAYYKKNGYSYREYNPEEELLEHIELLKTPVLRVEGRFYCGFNQNEWKKIELK